MEDLTGREFGPYRILAPLGEGGMAAVFKAYHPGMDRYVALKVLPKQLAAEPEYTSRFEQEARILAKLQHPHILPVFSYGKSNGYTYIVMPFVETGTLADLMQNQLLTLGQIRSIVSQVGDALDYAHTFGLVHRDIKPSNILLDKRGNCLLTDFGVSKILEGTARLTETGGIIGTPAYMSPEQGRGEQVDGRSDIYSLGVVLYEMATGRVPYTAETPIAVIFKHIENPLPIPRELNSALPEGVENVILKALAKSPQDRFATAGEMVRELRAAIPAGLAPGIDPEATGAPRSSPRKEPRGASKRWLLPVGGLILVTALVAAIAGLMAVSAKSSEIGGRATVGAIDSEQPTAAAVEESVLPDSTPSPTWTWTSTPTLAPVPSSTPFPTATPTLAPSTMPSPTLAPTETVTPTSTPIPPTLTPIPPTLAPICPPVTSVFAAAWSQVKNEIGCASEAAIAGLVVEESFQFGKMFWREQKDYAQALVMFNNGSWRIFQHTPFVEGSPEYSCLDSNTPAQTPPTPKRGFGMMWCDIPEIRAGLGNATNAEWGYSGVTQGFDSGFMIQTDQGEIYVFYATGAWQKW